MFIRLRSAALAACAAALALVAGPALADPALWVVKSKSSTVYLFGTVHAIDPKQAWRTAALDKAFHDSSELWLEVPLAVTPAGSAQPFAPEEGQRVAQLMLSLGTTTDGPRLTSRLTPAETDKLIAYLPAPKASLDRMRPWLAAAMVSVGFAQKLGLSVLTGADIVLDQEAGAEGKPVRGFETYEQQLHFFADLTPEEEMGYLRQSLAEADGGKARLEALERAWLAGDDEALSKMVVGAVKQFTPALYQRVVVDRNKRWIPEIETMLKTPGVRFIAVGAGHVTGPDGVVALLRKDGWRVERVQ